MDKNYSNLILYVLCGLALFILFIFFAPLFSNYNAAIFDGTIDLQKTANIGDFIGGVFGSILTSLTLFYVVRTYNFQQMQSELENGRMFFETFDNALDHQLKNLETVLNENKLIGVEYQGKTIEEISLDTFWIPNDMDFWRIYNQYNKEISNIVNCFGQYLFLYDNFQNDIKSKDIIFRSTLYRKHYENCDRLIRNIKYFNFSNEFLESHTNDLIVLLYMMNTQKTLKYCVMDRDFPE